MLARSSAFILDFADGGDGVARRLVLIDLIGHVRVHGFDLNVPGEGILGFICKPCLFCEMVTQQQRKTTTTTNKQQQRRTRKEKKRREEISTSVANHEHTESYICIYILAWLYEKCMIYVFKLA